MCALQIVSSCANRRADAQPALQVLRRAWIFQLLLDVLNCDQALKVVGIVHDEQLLDAMLVQDFFRALKRRSDRNSDQILFGHHPADRNIEARFKAEIAISQDPD